MEFFKISQSTFQPIQWNTEQYLSFLIEPRLFSVSKHSCVRPFLVQNRGTTIIIARLANFESV